MTTAISHRGEGDGSLWVSESVGLGHQHLSTTPESLAELFPLVDSESGLVLIADARIDNRDELITVLGHEERTGVVTDASLILSAYARFGESCTDHLVGAFAFAIWSAEDQTLFCARDHMGVKPFYYFASTDVFLLGSEIKALTALSQVPVDLDELRVAEYLTSTFEDEERTIYYSIRRLPPAHTMTVSASGMETRKYWSLDTSNKVSFDSDEEYIRKFREILNEAVTCRLRSAHPVATDLSGGLDSSAITALAREHLRENDNDTELITYSAVFNHTPACDERSYIRDVVDQGGLDSRYIHFDQSGPLTRKEYVFEYEDEPFITSNYFLTLDKLRVVAQDGVRVVLDGHDGDTTVSHGESYLTELAFNGEWKGLSEAIKAHSAVYPEFSIHRCIRKYAAPALSELFDGRRYFLLLTALLALGKHLEISRKKLLSEYFFQKIRFFSVNESVREQSKPAHEEEESLISNKLAGKLDFWNYRDRQLAKYQTVVRSARAAHALELDSGLITLALEQVDRMAAATGVELRHPFMDKRLIEYCLALPGNFKRREGLNRWVMREAMKDILPERIRLRTDKANMHHNLLRSMVDIEGKEFSSIVNGDLTDVEDYIDTDGLRRIQARIESKQPKSADFGRLWHGIHLILWLRRRDASTKFRTDFSKFSGADYALGDIMHVPNTHV